MREYYHDHSGLDIRFYVESESKNKYDTTYFGHIQIHKYRTWAYFTQSQLDYINQQFNLISKETKKSLHNTSSGNHFTKAKAKEFKFYFNTIVFFIYYGANFRKSLKNKIKYYDYDKFVNRYHDTSVKNYIHDKIVMFKKIPHSLLKYFSDRNQIVFNEKTPYHFNNIQEFYFGDLSRFLKNNNIEDIDFLDYLPRCKDNSFEKDFIKFINNNRLYVKNGKELTFNLDLLKAVIFISKVFNNYEFKSFKEYKKCLLKVFKDKACFKNELRYCLNNEELKHFFIIFNAFTDEKVNPVTIFCKWKFYSNYHEKISKVIIKLLNKSVDFTQYKNPFYNFRFLSSRYSFEEKGNFKLPIKDTTIYSGKDLEKNYSMEIVIDDNTTLKLVDDYKTLVACGAKLHNCAGSEETIKYYKKTITLGLYIDNELKYLISMKGFDIRQFKGFRNSSPPVDLFRKVVNKLKSEGYIIDSYKIPYKEVCVQSYDGRHL